MKLYIGNPNRSRLELNYVLPEMPPMKRFYTLSVPAGGQALMPHDLSQMDVNTLIEAWGPRAVEYNAVDRAKHAIGWTWRVEKPVSENVLESGVEKNTGEAIKRSERVFEESGIALADVVAKRAREEGNPVRKVAVSVQQDFEGPKPPKNIVSKGVEVRA